MNDGKPLWGARFSKQPDANMMSLTTSIDVDMVLLPFDLAATKAHARALEKAGLIDPDEVFAVADACDSIETEWRAGDIGPAPDDEDVHSMVERLLTERLGETGRRIHAGRSRNDLVASDLRSWCMAATDQLKGGLADLLDVIAGLAEEHSASVMPGYTHLQRAQPISLGFHLAAHGFALARDGARFQAARESADISSLGAGALAGTTLPIDPSVAAAELGFSAQFDNAMDAVADRDFAVDLAYACAMCMVHLSRLAEEIVLWTGSEFAFARLDDAWSTGSSMMPQKRNPDMAELVRGRAAPAIGELTSLLSLLKGLPLAYDRDLQEDKALVFASVARALGCPEGMVGLLATLTFDKQRMEQATRSSSAWATDLAEALVARGVPFRDTHGIVGELVGSLEADDLSFSDLTPEALAARDPRFEAGDLHLADPSASLARRDGPGGTAPTRVLEQATKLRVAAASLRP